jgi:hypothetical protein
MKKNMKKKWKEFKENLVICLLLFALWFVALLYVTDNNEDNTVQYYQDAQTGEYCPVDLDE